MMESDSERRGMRGKGERKKGSGKETNRKKSDE